MLETLSTLVGHSLVAPDGRGRGEPRFRMLETVREFAAERLDASGDRPAVMAALTGYLADLAARAEVGIRGGASRRWLGRLDAELETLSSGVEWALASDDAALAVRLTAPLARYWWTRGLLGQMLDVAERTAALPSAVALAPREGALLTWTRGTIRVALGRAGEAVPLLEEVVAAARAQDEPTVLAPALFSLALVTPIRARGLGTGACAARGVAGALPARPDDDWGVAWPSSRSATCGCSTGDVQAAVPLHEEVLRRAQAVDDDHMRAQAHDQLSLDAMLAGDLAAATRHLRAAAALHRALRDHEGIAYCLEGFAALALAGGQQPAVRLFGTAEEARQLLAVAVWPFMRPLRARLETFARPRCPTVRGRVGRGRAVEPLTALDEALASLGEVGGP